jgi:prevent-host-death family protein
MSLVLNATNARANFFDILNRVIYGGETIYVTKAGTDEMVKLETVSNSKKALGELAGSWSKKEADGMMKAVETTRSYPKRKVLSFD